MIKRETVEKVLRGPFSLEEYRFQRLLLLLLPPPFLFLGSIRFRFRFQETSEQALEKQSAISRLRRPSSSMAKSRLPKKRVIRDERRGWFSEERETRRLFRTEIGTTRSLRHSRTLECRYDEERTRHSSRIRPREEAKNRTEE